MNVLFVVRASMALHARPAPWADGGRCKGICCFDRGLGPQMVLQRDTQARVWGTAGPADSISIGVDGPGGTEAPIPAVTDATGSWFVDLPMHAGSTSQYTITLTCKNAAGTESVQIRVFCSGTYLAATGRVICSLDFSMT